MNRLLISKIRGSFFHRQWLWLTRLFPLMVMLGCVFEPQAGPVVAVVGDRHVTAANELRKRALAGENLGKPAAQHAPSPESNRYAEVEWIPKGYLDERLERAVFSLKPGQISPVVRGPSGYHIFEVLSRRDSGMQDYGKLVQEIEQRIIEQKKADLYREWLKKLRAEIPVRINREALDKMELS